MLTPGWGTGTRGGSPPGVKSICALVKVFIISDHLKSERMFRALRVRVRSGGRLRCEPRVQDLAEAVACPHTKRRCRVLYGAETQLRPRIRIRIGLQNKNRFAYKKRSRSRQKGQKEITSITVHSSASYLPECQGRPQTTAHTSSIKCKKSSLR